MEKIDLAKVAAFVNREVVGFHEQKLKSLENLSLDDILKKKNPYLFRAKHLVVASDLINEMVIAHLSSSEEKLFGDFLELLALFIAQNTCGAKKSASSGIDFEFDRKKTRYLVSVKSGTNWGNSGQHEQQKTNFAKAVKVIKQSKSVAQVEAVLGICYGKTRSSFLHGYHKVVGQSFWYLISENKNLYTDIIEPLGYKAKEHNENFLEKKATLVNLLTKDFLQRYCINGQIDWKKIVQFNSGNMK